MDAIIIVAVNWNAFIGCGVHSSKINSAAAL